MLSLQGRLRLLTPSSVRETLSLELSISMPYKNSEISTAKVRSKDHRFFFNVVACVLYV